MDKIKDFITNALGKAIGTSVAGFTARIVIALLALWTGSATDLGDAVGQVIDKDRSIASCVEVISETPKAEVIEAVKENE